MQPSRSSAGALRFVALVMSTILLFAIITFGLAVVYGKQMTSAPLDPYETAHRGAYPHAHHWPNAYFIFYSGTMPFLTILQSSADLILYFMTRLNPIYALTVSIVFLCGWAIQLGF